MATIAKDRPRATKPPSWAHLGAVALELGIVGSVIRSHSWVGLLLCCLYAWYSATWALLFREE